MASPTRPAKRFNRKKLLVTLAVVAVLGVLVAFLVVPYVTGILIRGAQISCVSETHCIHIAAMSMATDGETNKDTGLGWPGDLKANGRIANLSDYVNLLVRNGYLNAADLKIFSGPGFKPYKGTLTSGSNGVLDPPFTEENCAFKVYLVKKDDPSNTVFLVSKNYTYNMPLNPQAKPFGGKGFIVSRKGGDACLLKNEQAQSLQMNRSGTDYYVGKLPDGGTVESAENCLNPGQ